MHLSKEAIESIHSAMSRFGGTGNIKNFDYDATEVVDSTYKFVVTDKYQYPRLFVLLSPIEFPNAAVSAANKVELIRSSLSPGTREMVLQPFHVGMSNGTSYSLSLFCSGHGSNRLVRLWNRRWLRRDLSQWLLAVCQETIVSPSADDIPSNFIDPLRVVAAHPLLGSSLKHTAESALKELETGLWKPKHVLAHNDLWAGNVLLPAQSQIAASTPFVVIDWGGANAKSYAIYDLARMALSFRMRESTLRREIRLHCNALSCSPRQARYHLATSLGNLALNLGQFPESRFVTLAERVSQLIYKCTSD
jgi:hypothetical protein